MDLLDYIGEAYVEFIRVADDLEKARRRLDNFAITPFPTIIRSERMWESVLDLRSIETDKKNELKTLVADLVDEYQSKADYLRSVIPEADIWFYLSALGVYIMRGSDGVHVASASSIDGKEA